VTPDGAASAGDLIAAILRALFEGWAAGQRHLDELRLAALARAQANQAKVHGAPPAP
jgi:hypothetical protein